MRAILCLLKPKRMHIFTTNINTKAEIKDRIVISYCTFVCLPVLIVSAFRFLDRIESIFESRLIHAHGLHACRQTLSFGRPTFRSITYYFSHSSLFDIPSFVTSTVEYDWFFEWYVDLSRHTNQLRSGCQNNNLELRVWQSLKKSIGWLIVWFTQLLLIYHARAIRR